MVRDDKDITDPPPAK